MESESVLPALVAIESEVLNESDGQARAVTFVASLSATPIESDNPIAAEVFVFATPACMPRESETVLTMPAIPADWSLIAIESPTFRPADPVM